MLILTRKQNQTVFIGHLPFATNVITPKEVQVSWCGTPYILPYDTETTFSGPFGDFQVIAYPTAQRDARQPTVRVGIACPRDVDIVREEVLHRRKPRAEQKRS